MQIACFIPTSATEHDLCRWLHFLQHFSYRTVHIYTTNAVYHTLQQQWDGELASEVAWFRDYQLTEQLTKTQYNLCLHDEPNEQRLRALLPIATEVCRFDWLPVTLYETNNKRQSSCFTVLTVLRDCSQHEPVIQWIQQVFNQWREQHRVELVQWVIASTQSMSEHVTTHLEKYALNLETVLQVQHCVSVKQVQRLLQRCDAVFAVDKQTAVEGWAHHLPVLGWNLPVYTLPLNDGALFHLFPQHQQLDPPLRFMARDVAVRQLHRLYTRPRWRETLANHGFEKSQQLQPGLFAERLPHNECALPLTGPVHTTPRGVRYLARVERIACFHEQQVLVDEPLAEAILWQALNAATVEALMVDHPRCSYTLGWLLQQELLKLGERDKPRSPNINLPAALQREFADIEQATAAVLDVCKPLLGEMSALLKVQLLNPVRQHVHAQLCQALGWLQLTTIHLPTICQQLPRWYRTNKHHLLYMLKAGKQIVQRVTTDLSAINAHFAANATAIAGIHWPLSHSVCETAIVKLNDNSRVIYKSHNLALEETVLGESGIAVTLNQWLTGKTHINTLKQLPRGSYGYSEWITGKQQPASVEYYHQLGALGAFAALLGMVDIHQRNIISHGDTLTLIDAKVAFHQPLIELAHNLNSTTVLAQCNLLELFTQPPFHQPISSGYEWHDGALKPTALTRSIATAQHPAQQTPQNADAVSQGMQWVFDAVAHHQVEWQRLLQRCNGLLTTVTPRWDQTLLAHIPQSLVRELGFQYLTTAELNDHLLRCARRLTMSSKQDQDVAWLEKMLVKHWLRRPFVPTRLEKRVKLKEIKTQKPRT